MVTISSKEDYSSKTYLAFFDLDHTITRSVSGRELIAGAYKRGLLSRDRLAVAIFLSMGYKLKLINPGKAISMMGSWLKGIPVKTIDHLSSEVFNDVLLPSIYPQIIDEIKLHRDANAGLVLLSSTIVPVCRKMEDHLGMDDSLCTELDAIDGILTGRTNGKYCFGEEKAVRMREYCEKNNSTLLDAWYYGDAFADLPALSAVGNPVCINPERKLEKIAKKNGWRIYYWNN